MNTLRNELCTLATALATITLAPSAILGQDWYRQATETSPAARRFHGMTFDAARGTTVLFGGVDERTPTVFGDTWTFDGTRWIEQSPSVAPAARQRFGICYDSHRGRVLLFGGSDAGGATRSDTWSFDGSNWTLLQPTTSPTPRDAVTLAYDANRDRVVLFGGRGADGAALDDTWEFDGLDWAPITTSVAPPRRHSHVTTWYAPTGNVVLFGGFEPNTNRFGDDTWSYDGTGWVEVAPTTVPTSMVLPSLEFHRDHGVAVLTGSVGVAGQRVRTFAFDGSDWHVGPPPADDMSGRQGHATAYDSSREALVLFGGASISLGGALPRDDTFELSIPATAVAFGTGCASIAGVMHLDPFPGFDQPAIGEHFGMQAGPLPETTMCFLAIGMSASVFEAVTLPLDLELIGMPGCLLLVSIDAVLPMTVADGVGLLGFDLPLRRELLGSELFVQALAPGVAVSNGLQVTLGN